MRLCQRREDKDLWTEAYRKFGLVVYGTECQHISAVGQRRWLREGRYYATDGHEAKRD